MQMVHKITLQCRVTDEVRYLALIVWSYDQDTGHEMIDTVYEADSANPDMMLRLKRRWKFQTDMPLYKRQIDWLLQTPPCSLEVVTWS